MTWEWSLKDYIDYYLKLGFALIPCAPRSKRPIVGWKEYQSNPPTPDQVYSWFSGGKELNIAVILGAASDNLIAIDFDNPELYPKLFNREKVEKSTLVVRTGKGYHVYFRTEYPMPTVKFNGIEVRGEGAITILPPSIHPSGKRYEFISKPDSIPVVEEVEGAIIKKLKSLGITVRKTEEKKEKFNVNIKVRGRRDIPPCFKWLMRARIKEGWRNESLCRVVSTWRLLGYPEDKIYKMAWEWNLKHCDPPLDRKEVERTVKSMLKHGYTYWCRSMLPVCNEEMKKKCKLYKKDVKKLKSFIRRMPIIIG